MITEPRIEEYCVQHSTPPSSAQLGMIEVTRSQLPQSAQMQVGALEGRFLTMITRLCQAERVLEFGTFTGYSALAFAEGIPPRGRVTTLDIDPRATQIAREHWAQSEHGSKIELILGNALESARKLVEEVGQTTRPPFDLVFIDADKGNYPHYYELSLSLLKPGGLILVDNVLWGGAVLSPEDPSDHAICKFNESVRADVRVEKILLPLRDGIYLIRKREA